MQHSEQHVGDVLRLTRSSRAEVSKANKQIEEADEEEEEAEGEIEFIQMTLFRIWALVH